MKTMVESLLVGGLVIALVVGPLLWRIRMDRAHERAMIVHADIDAAVRRTLGGESLLSIDVEPATPWHRGRVVLTAPRQWEWLVKAVVAPVLERTPADYEVIVPAAPAVSRVPEVRPLRAAA
jgi:hypothetical protein